MRGRTGFERQQRPNCQTLLASKIARSPSANPSGILLQAQERPSPPTPLPRIRGRGQQDASRMHERFGAINRSDESHPNFTTANNASAGSAIALHRTWNTYRVARAMERLTARRLPLFLRLPARADTISCWRRAGGVMIGLPVY